MNEDRSLIKPTRHYKIIVAQEGKRWVSYVPALNFISTWGDTEAELMERTKEMIEGFQVALIKQRTYWPLPIAEHSL